MRARTTPSSPTTRSSPGWPSRTPTRRRRSCAGSRRRCTASRWRSPTTRRSPTTSPRRRSCGRGGRRRPTTRCAAPSPAWLLTITRNVAIDAVRARRSVPADDDELDRLLQPTFGGEVADATGEAATDHVEAARMLARLRGAASEQARAVVLAVFGGCTAEEISRRDGVPLGTAKTRIRTGLRRLRDANSTRRGREVRRWLTDRGRAPRRRRRRPRARRRRRPTAGRRWPPTCCAARRAGGEYDELAAAVDDLLPGVPGCSRRSGSTSACSVGLGASRQPRPRRRWPWLVAAAAAVVALLVPRRLVGVRRPAATRPARGDAAPDRRRRAGRHGVGQDVDGDPLMVVALVDAPRRRVLLLPHRARRRHDRRLRVVAGRQRRVDRAAAPRRRRDDASRSSPPAPTTSGRRPASS